MKKVLLRAPVLTQSGYGCHARQIFSWLSKNKNIDLHTQLLQWGTTPWFIDHAQSELIENIMKSSKPCEKPDMTFQLQLPNEWDPNLSSFNVGMTAGIETTIASPEWAMACNRMNVVIVPSEHAKKSLLAGGNITTPIFIVPESFPNSFLKENDSQFDIDLSSEFNFLIFGQITGNDFHSDRKGVLSAIKWLCEEFKDDERVGIVVKTNRGKNSLIDRDVTTTILKQLVQNVRKTSVFPKIKLVHGHLSDEEVAAIYNNPKIKAAVALTRGEGFGLPILEAAAMGIPVVTTGWSGHMDFMKLGKFINVAYNLSDVHPSKIDNKMFMQGARWAEPSEIDFKKRVRKLVDAYEIPKQWAIELSHKIREKYTHNAICDAYDAITIITDKLKENK